MRNVFRALGVASVVAGVVALSSVVGQAHHPPSPPPPSPQAIPWLYVGPAGDCGAGYAAGSRIVTSAWLHGIGLPDGGGLNVNVGNPADNPNKSNDHEGLLLSKNGPTPDCSSAGASIKFVKNTLITVGFTLGFDIRNGTHCGGGAPRFNVETVGGTFTFVGNCAAATATAAPQDPAWTRVRWDTTNAVQMSGNATLIPGDRIKTIDIVFDEGTDSGGAGLAVIDNIYINGKVIAHD